MKQEDGDGAMLFMHESLLMSHQYERGRMLALTSNRQHKRIYIYASRMVL